MKYIGYIREHFNDPKSPVVTLRELEAVLKLKGIKPPYMKRIINYLMSRGELKRITKGVYTLHEDVTVVGFAFRPFYYGLENALTILKLWEQGTNPIVITTRNIRQGARKFDGGNYSLYRIKREKFFGFDIVKYYDFWIPVSNYEKTLIDFVLFGHHLREDVLLIIRRRIKRRKLNLYLRSFSPDVRRKVLALLGKKH